MCVHGPARTLRVTVKTFHTRVPILSSMLSISSPRLSLPRQGKYLGAGDISNAFVKQPGLHSRVSLHNEYRVIGHLQSVRFEMRFPSTSENFSSFETVHYVAERMRECHSRSFRSRRGFFSFSFSFARKSLKVVGRIFEELSDFQRVNLGVVVVKERVKISCDFRFATIRRRTWG